MNYMTERFAKPATDTATAKNVGKGSGYVVGATRDRVVMSHTDGNTTGEGGREETGTSTRTTREAGRRTTAMNRGQGK